MARSLVEIYGAAILDVVVDKGNVEQALRDALNLRELFIENPKLRQIYSSPMIDDSEKHEMARELFANRLSSPYMRNFVDVVIDRNHFDIFTSIIEEFIKLGTHHIHAKDAFVYTARPLTEDEQARIAIALQDTYKVKVFLHNVIDKSVLGGARIVMEDETVDNSVSHRLQELKQRIFMGTR